LRCSVSDQRQGVEAVWYAAAAAASFCTAKESTRTKLEKLPKPNTLASSRRSVAVRPDAASDAAWLDVATSLAW